MIVSDSTAIITLINIDEFTLLESFTRQVLLAPEVYEEVVVDKKAHDFLKQQIETGFVKVDSYHDTLLFQELNILLDKRGVGIHRSGKRKEYAAVDRREKGA